MFYKYQRRKFETIKVLPHIWIKTEQPQRFEICGMKVVQQPPTHPPTPSSVFSSALQHPPALLSAVKPSMRKSREASHLVLIREERQKVQKSEQKCRKIFTMPAQPVARPAWKSLRQNWFTAFAPIAWPIPDTADKIFTSKSFRHDQNVPFWGLFRSMPKYANVSGGLWTMRDNQDRRNGRHQDHLCLLQV